MARKRRLDESVCENCFGCGHICTRCKYPVNGCFCDGLDTEEMRLCNKCKGTGVIPPDVIRKPVSLGDA